VRRSQCAKAAGFLRSVGVVRPAQGFAGIVIAAQDSACFSGAGFPDDAAFASPISVRVFSRCRCENEREGLFHGNLQAAGTCLYAIFYPYADRFFDLIAYA
jgi:hypothetical protein